MNYGSLCSGIEAATVAWEPLGWKPAWFSEIDKFPCAVLAHHYPDVPNLGDMTRYKEWGLKHGAVDLIIGGTPCQSFSVAGLRKGLDDPRGNLALVFLGIVDAARPEWVVWENVPGVLSSVSHESPDPCEPPPPVDLELDGQEVDTEDEYDGEELHALNSFLAGLSELGYGWSLRVLDAQYFGVPQRRRRVFVVGYSGDWRPAAAVLFESHSLQGHPPPRREKGQGATYDLAPCIGASGRGFERAGDTRGQDCVVTHTLRGEGFDASEDGTGRGTPLVTGYRESGQGYWQEGNGLLRSEEGGTVSNLVCMAHGAVAVRTAQTGVNGIGVSEETAHTLDGTGGEAVCFHRNASCAMTSQGDKTAALKSGGEHSYQFIAFNSDQSEKTRSMGEREEQTPTLRADGEVSVDGGSTVRRLTPRECERLQGFPDDYSRIPWRGKPAGDCPDGPRYKALGNSMAVPVMRWIGERIMLVREILAERG